MLVNDRAEKTFDTVVGTVATVAGSGGLTLTLVHEVMSVAAIALNILLTLGGLHLLWLRVQKARRDAARDKTLATWQHSSVAPEED